MNPQDPVEPATPQPAPANGGPARPAEAVAPRVIPVSLARPQATLTTVMAHFSGPLPPPQVLAEYDRILPGSAERLMKQMEAQSVHRREVEKIVIQGNVRDSRLGIIAGGIVTVAALALAAFAVHKGQPVVATTIASVTIGSLVTVFVTGTRSASKELADKGKASPVPAPAAPPPAAA